MTVSVENEKASAGLEEYTMEFLEDRLSEFEQMRAFYGNSDMAQVKAMAHKWKGFCGPYGFNLLETLSRDLEMCIENGNLDEVSPLLEKISKYLIKKEAILKRG